MGYTPNLQFLAPGATMMPRANPIPFSALMEDKKWREENKDKLATNQALVNASFEDVRATNEYNAGILEEKKAYYEAERDRILNDKKMTTSDKYRAMNILGKSAADDVELNAIRGWTNDYQTNLKLAEEAATTMDQDVYRATLDEIEKRNQVGIGPLSETMAYNKWSTVKGIETPDIAKDAMEFLKNMKPDTEIVTKSTGLGQPGAILRKDGNNGYFNKITGEYINEAEAIEIAKGYIAQQPGYKEFFERKDIGAEANLRDKLKSEGKTPEEIDAEIQSRKERYGGTVYDKDLYIKEGITPAAKAASYYKEDGQVVQDWQLKDALDEERAKRKAAAEAAAKTPETTTVYESKETGLEGTPNNVIGGVTDYQTRVANQRTTVAEAEQKLLDYQKGKIVLTDYEAKSLKLQVSQAKAELESLEDIKQGRRTEQIEKGTFEGFRYATVDRYENNNILNPETGAIDIWGGRGNEIVPGTNETYKQYVSHTVQGRDFDELGELWEDIYKGDGKYFEAFSPFMKQIFGPNLTDTELKSTFNSVMRFYPQSKLMHLLRDPKAKGPELVKSYEELMGASLPTNKEDREKITSAIANINQPGKAAIVYKELVKNGKSKEKAQAIVKMLEAFDGSSDYKNVDINKFLENAVKRDVDASNNYFNNYLEKNKNTLQPSAPIYASIPGATKDALKTKMNNIVTAINTTKNNFVFTDGAGNVVDQEDLEGVTIKGITKVGLDEMYYGEGEEQQIPLVVTGTVGTGEKKKDVKYVIYGSRENKDVYSQLADYLQESNAVDAPKGNMARNPVTGELIKPNDRTMTDYLTDFLRNEHSIDNAFEAKINNTPVQGKGTFSFGTFADVENYRTQNGAIQNVVDPKTVKISFQKTGNQNYIFQSDAKTNPILAMREAMIKNIDGFEGMLDRLPTTMSEVDTSKMTPQQQSMMQSLITMKNSYEIMKKNNFKVQRDSEVDAKIYLRNLQQVYMSMYQNLNTDINNYFQIADMLSR